MRREELIKYLKDNPNNYWFKRKLYGWGWTPVKWQGWLVIAIFGAFIVWSSMLFDSNSEPTASQLTWFFVKILLASVILIAICYKKGEKPKWQWGIPKEKNKA